MIDQIKITAEQSMSDKRLAGLAVGASWFQDAMDAWSDLELNLVIYPQFFNEVMEDIYGLAPKYGYLLTLAQGKHTGEQRLFTLPDFAIRVENPSVIWQRNHKLSDLIAQHPGQYPFPDQQWIENQFWIWIHYGLNKIERDEYLEVVDHFGFLRNKVLGPLLSLKLNQAPRRIRRAEEKLPQTLYARLKNTRDIAEPKSLFKALWTTLTLHQEIRNATKITLRTQAGKWVVERLYHS